MASYKDLIQELTDLKNKGNGSNVNIQPESAARMKLQNQLNQKIEIEYIKAHRWLYAQTKVPLGKSFLKNKDSTLYIGGDWCLGANVQAAFDSGLKIAEFINLKFDK